MLFQDGTLIEVTSRDVDEERFVELSAMKGGRTEDGQFVELVHLVFIQPGAGEAHLALCKQYGIGCRAMDEGVERILYEGQRVRRGAGTSEGTLLPLLREEKWPHLETVIHRRLIPGAAEQGPWVTFGMDAGDAVARFGPQHLEGKTIEDVERRALANLARRDLAVVELGPGLLRIGDEYAAEAILLPELMRSLQARLSVRLMLVNIPTEGGLVATTGEDPQRAIAMTELARKHFDETSGRRISPLPLLVQDGAILGYVTVSEGGGAGRGAAAGEKPWWKFW